MRKPKYSTVCYCKCTVTKLSRDKRCQGCQSLKGAKGAWVNSSEGLLGGRAFSRTHFRSSLTPEEGPSCLLDLTRILNFAGCETWQITWTNCLSYPRDLWISDWGDQEENLSNCREGWSRIKSGGLFCQVRSYVWRNDLAEKSPESTLFIHCVKIHAILEHFDILVFNSY